MALDTFDLSQLNAIFLGHKMGGYGDDGALVIERQTPVWGYKIGVDGRVTRYKNLQKITKVTITFAPMAPSLDVLHAIALLDELATNGAGVGLFSCTHLGGTFSISDDSAWIEGPAASVEFSNVPGDKQLIIWLPSPKRFG